MRNKFRSIAELFGVSEPIRFTHSLRDGVTPLPNWIDQYETEINSLIERFCQVYLQFPLIIGPEEERTIYEFSKICNKVLCEIRFQNNPYLDSDDMPSNSYNLVLICKYLSIEGQEEKIEKDFYFNSFPNSSYVHEILVSWFNEINIDLNRVIDSAAVHTSTTPNDGVFDYNPQLDLQNL